MNTIFFWNFLRIILIASFGAIISSQIFKFILNGVIEKKVNLKTLTADADFPSSHTAFTTAFSVISIIVITESVEKNNTENLVLAIGSVLVSFLIVNISVIIRDALGVRRITGQNSLYLKETLSILSENKIEKAIQARFKEIGETICIKSGHLPHEVIGGAFLGVLVAMIVATKEIFLDYTSYYLLIVAAVLYVIIMIFWVSRKSKKKQ